MKLTLGLAAVVLMCFVSLACAKPQDKASTTAKPYADVTASKSVKDAIAEAKKKKNCYAECDKLTEVYEPVCAHDPANPQTKPRTFGNECVMKAHNCEMGTKLALKSKGECSGSGGVRVS